MAANWERRKYLLDGLRKALNIKLGMDPRDDGDWEEEDWENLIWVAKNCCVNQFEPVIQVVKECPQNNPGKWGKTYDCVECWLNILINNKLYAKKEFVEPDDD